MCEESNKSFGNCEILVADEELTKTDFLLKELFSVGKTQQKNFILKPLNQSLMEIIQDREKLKYLEEKAKEKKYIVDGLSKFLYLKDLIDLAFNECSSKQYE